jgi:uncharacterized protein YbjT (DUF2867 family)
MVRVPIFEKSRWMERFAIRRDSRRDRALGGEADERRDAEAVILLRFLFPSQPVYPLMKIAVLGANGGIGRLLLPQLAEAGHEPIGVVRSEDQFDAVRERGGEPRFGDLERSFAPALEGADAVVFTAGSGGSTGWDKTIMVDLWGARRAVDVCEERGIDRFVMVSARGAADPDSGYEPLRPYLVAKRCADEYLLNSSVADTILRPTTLTDEEGTGQITAAFEPAGGGENIPRADVATAIVACLEDDATVGHTIELYGGDTPVANAVHPTEN